MTGEGSNGTKTPETMTTTKMGLRIASKHATTMLERSALRWLNEKGRDYANGAAGAYYDLMQGGCQAGTVSHLIYYRDTLRFYSRHRKDIAALLTRACEGIGANATRGAFPAASTTGSLANLFGAKWDTSDPMAVDTNNRNLLAWFGFEEAARNVANSAGIED